MVIDKKVRQGFWFGLLAVALSQPILSPIFTISLAMLGKDYSSLDLYLTYYALFAAIPLAALSVFAIRLSLKGDPRSHGFLVLGGYWAASYGLFFGIIGLFSSIVPFIRALISLF